MARRLPLASAILGAAVLACGPPRAGTQDRPNVVVFCLDTVRADRMSLYGGPRPTTPNLDRLAKRAVVFEDAQSPAPWTLPSVASLLTGLSPARHGAGIHGPARNLEKMRPDALPDEIETLAERFATAGYRCEAFVTNPLFRAGLQQGFEAFAYAQTEGAEVSNHAIEALSRLDGEPFFLWLHYMDAHDPLLAPTEDVLAMTRAPEEKRTGAVWARTFRSHKVKTFRDERLVLYDAALHYLDRQVARVLDALERQGLADDTIVVVVSDHGEEILDHAEAAGSAGYTDPRGTLGIGHGHALFVEQLRVPLILGVPGLAPRRIPELVSLVDVAPTLLELAGLGGAPPPLEGRSLVPLLRGEGWEERPLMAEGLAYGPDRRAWVEPEWKLIVGGEGEAPPALPEARRSVRGAEPRARRARTSRRAAGAPGGARGGRRAENGDARRPRRGGPEGPARPGLHGERRVT